MHKNTDETVCQHSDVTPVEDHQQPSIEPLSGIGEHPLRPRLVVRVGVTGHRTGLPPQLDELSKAIRVALCEIKKITKEISERGTEVYLPNEDKGKEAFALRLISPLAEGADRLVAQIALGLGFELQCPMPFHEKDYEKDLEKSEEHPDRTEAEVEDSKSAFRQLKDKNVALELDGLRDTKKEKDEAYEAVGRVVLWQSDVLIAIWDGKEGEKGGTSQVVRDALTLAIPTIWINSQPGHKTALWEPGQRPGDPGRESDLSLLSKRLKSIFLFPIGEKIERPQRFWEEKKRSRSFGFIFKAFCKAWVWDWDSPSWRVKDFWEKAEGDWTRTWAPLKEADPKVTANLQKGYLSSFAWADGLADFYANRYRSSFVATYLMGALAILFAFLGSRQGAHHGLLWIEAILITAIIVLTAWGRRKDWHERWMDYRFLAEGLRQIQFLTLLGRVNSSFRVPTHLEASDLRNSWFNWYFRALVRQAGMIGSKLDSLHLDAYRQVLAGWIQSQVEYHTGNSKKYHSLHKRLRKITGILFVVTALACVLHLLPHYWSGLHHFLDSYQDLLENYELWLSILVIVLPAFGGALGAIVHIGEFERIAIRSKALKQRLETLSCQLHCLGEQANSRDLGHLAQMFSDIALDELIDWRFVFLEKDLTLPA